MIDGSTLLAFILAIVAVGCAVGWGRAQNRAKDFAREKEEAQNNLSQIQIEQAELKAQLQSEQQAHKKFSEEIKATFAQLAGEALSKNNDDFLKLANERFQRLQQQSESSLEKRQEAVKNLVKPIQDALQENKTTINKIEEQRREAYGEIKQQIKTMSQDQNALREETGKLVNALHRPQVRGRYGEVTLRKVVELAGMTSYCDFIEQTSTTDDDGKISRPDMRVNMPSQRSLIIDAKTPLENYLNAIDAVDADARAQLLKRHAGDVKTHIKSLALKAYWTQFEQTPEFVVMFIPGDQFLHAALEQDPTLLEYAMENKIILTTPASLMGLLRAVAYGWQQETIAENLNEIKKSGEILLERIGTFIGHVNKLGKSLKGSVNAYNDAVGSFKRRLMPAAHQLKKHDIRGKKELPDKPQSITDIDAIDSIADDGGGESGG